MIGGVLTVARRDLGMAARQARTYQWRVTAALGALLAILGGIALTQPALLSGWTEAPPNLVRASARAGFVGQVVVLGSLMLGMISNLAGSSIAGEREKKTLDSLIATPLSSFEIVMGLLLACWIRCGAGLVAVTPFIVFLGRFGGAPGPLILAVLVGVFTSAVLLGSIGMAVSVRSRTIRPSIGWTVMMIVVWLEVPFVLTLAGPRLFPSVFAWIQPVNRVVLDSSPIRILAHFVGLIPGNSLFSVLARMAVLQLAASFLLVVSATARLRPISRRLAGGEPRFRMTWFSRVRRRPPCGDDPMGWKERYVSHSSLGTRLTSLLVYGVPFVLLAQLVSKVAVPAVREWSDAGYRWSSPMFLRWELNHAFVRPFSAVISSVLMIVLAGMTAEAIDLERKKDTWSVLLSTPLSGEEIVRAKRSSASRRCRPIMAMLGLLWLFATIIGALHPFGLILGGLSLLALVRLSLARGVHAGIMNRQGSQSSDRAVAWIMALMILAPLPCMLTGRSELAPLAALSPPVSIIFALISHNEVHATLGNETFVGIRILNLPAGGSGASWSVFSALFAPLVTLLLARWFERGTIARFDTAVGRPTRPPDQAEPQFVGSPQPAESLS